MFESGDGCQYRKPQPVNYWAQFWANYISTTLAILTASLIIFGAMRAYLHWSVKDTLNGNPPANVRPK